MVASEEQARGLVDEHHVALGVPGGGQRTQRPVGERDVGGRADPLIRCLPVLGGRATVTEGGKQCVPYRRGTTVDELLQLVRQRQAVGLHGLTQRCRLVLAEVDAPAELAAQRHRLGVVVTVHVGDQEAADIRQVGPDAAQRAAQLLTRLRKRPSRVDQGERGTVREGVDVDRAQAVGRQGQRNAVHARRHSMGARFRPVVARITHAASALPAEPPDTTAIR